MNQASSSVVLICLHDKACLTWSPFDIFSPSYILCLSKGVYVCVVVFIELSLNTWITLQVESRLVPSWCLCNMIRQLIRFFKFAIRSKLSKNNPKLIIICFFRSWFARKLVNHATPILPIGGSIYKLSGSYVGTCQVE